jgi:hypothetical protein
VGSIQKFKDGLWQGTLWSILNKETWCHRLLERG